MEQLLLTLPKKKPTQDITEKNHKLKTCLYKNHLVTWWHSSSQKHWWVANLWQHQQQIHFVLQTPFIGNAAMRIVQYFVIHSTRLLTAFLVNWPYTCIDQINLPRRQDKQFTFWHACDFKIKSAHCSIHHVNIQIVCQHSSDNSHHVKIQTVW